MAKNTNAFTGLTGFKYMVHGKEVKTVEDIKNLQEISVTKEQSIEKAYGDNGVAEMAVANSTVEISSTFHKLPIETRTDLFGLDVDEDGVVGVGDSTPPYVGVIFEKTMESGAVEYVGLPKGLFMLPEINGETKSDGVEFSQDEISGEFMQAEIEGFEKPQTMLLGHDEPGETTMRDKIYQLVFGTAHPEAGNTP